MANVNLPVLLSGWCTIVVLCNFYIFYRKNQKNLEYKLRTVSGPPILLAIAGIAELWLSDNGPLSAEILAELR